MSSAVKVHQSVVETFNAVKLRSEHKYVIFKISDDKTHIIIDDASEKHKTATEEEDKCYFEEMAARLTEAEPRYILFDFGFTTKGGRKLEKLAFAFWCSDNANVKKKMLYASSKDYIKKAFTGLMHEFQFNDIADLNYRHLRDEIEKKS